MIRTGGSNGIGGRAAVACSIIAFVFAGGAQAKCTNMIVTEYATATSRPVAERNVKAKLVQKLKKLSGDAAVYAETANIDCKQPLLWHCKATATFCK